MRRAALVVSLVAFAHAAAWAVVTPVMQIPDEPVHMGYAQKVAESRDLVPPAPTTWQASEELNEVFTRVPWTVLADPSWSPAEDRALQHVLDTTLAQDADGNAGYQAANPPLYPLVVAGPYLVSEAFGGDALDAILLMRLGSAVLAALAVLGVWLFLRELLPATPWAWSVGALAVAFQPMFAYIGGGVNNDNLMNVTGAWFLFVAARIVRRGFTLRRAAALGGVVAAALMTKVSAFAIAAALLVVLAFVVMRAGGERRRALAAAAFALAVAVVPYALYHTLGERTGTTATAGFEGGRDWYAPETLRSQVTYIWQFFLPKLWFMQDQFGTSYPLWDTYFQSFVGRFGWFQYQFSDAFFRVALAVYLAVVGLAAVAVWRVRAAWRNWAALAVPIVGLLVLWLLMVNVAGFRYRIEHQGLTFEQGRYLLPLVGVYGALIAVAARGAGRRWGPAVGVLLVVLSAGQSIAAMLLTFNRYYA